MFGGYVSYHRKGPCHIWCEETIAEGQESEKDIKQLNLTVEQEKKAEWKLELVSID
jgi:hypothetical protein